MVMRKRCSSGSVSFIKGSKLSAGRIVINSARARPLLDLGVVNSRSNSWRIMIQRANFLVITHRPSIYCIGLELVTT